MDILIKLLDVVVPVFAIIGIGFYLGKKNPNFNTEFIGMFALKFGTPALTFYAITSTGISYQVFIEYFFYTILAIACFSIVGVIFLAVIKRDYIRELPPLILPNAGNMGLPICFFAYGKTGLGVAAAISSVVIISHFTLGIFLASKKFSINILLKNPAIYSVIISVLTLYYELKIPIFIENITFLLSYATISLVLISLGIALTKLKVSSLKQASFLSFSRIIIGPLIGFVIIYFFELKGFAAGILLIQCSMPCAILTYLVGTMYSPKKISNNIAGTIVVSTLLSFLTIPIVVFFALKYFT